MIIVMYLNVSDWLTANCETVISTKLPSKYGFFTFICNGKMTSKSIVYKTTDAFASYYYDNENHIDSLTPLPSFRTFFVKKYLSIEAYLEKERKKQACYFFILCSISFNNC